MQKKILLGKLNERLHAAKENVSELEDKSKPCLKENLESRDKF